MVSMRHRTKFRNDRSNRCRDKAIFDFSKWRPSAVLHLSWTCLDHPRHFVVFITVQNLVGVYMQVLIFSDLVLKTGFRASKLGFWGM